MHQSGKFSVGYGESVTNQVPGNQAPIKVVPMYIEEASAEIPVVADEPEAQPEREKTALIGAAALAAAMLTAVLHLLAVMIASNGAYQVATVLGFVAIGSSVVSVGAGIVAIVLDRGRRLGIAAAVLGLVANPVVLLWILQFLSTLVA